jgi:two-component system sensor histidine kinase KdpD
VAPGEFDMPSTRRWAAYALAVAGIIVVTVSLKLFDGNINATTVALALLVVVLFVATAFGSGPAVVASLVGGVCFNYFFLPPVGTLNIADPHNWIALLAFLITAITAGQLSARAKRRAEEAYTAQQEVERLYHELQDSFERSSQAKALKQSERLKSALLDAVTHDLRTPLTSIKASVTTLLDGERSRERGAAEGQLGNEGRREMLEVIDEEADRLDRFIEGLMELARIEAGEMHLRRKWSSLNEIIVAAMKRAEPRTRAHRVELWLDEELPAVRVDERAMSEVVYVLVENAAKYSPPASVIRVLAKGGEESSVQLVVEDQGPGIPVELRERVFDKFFRAMRDGDKSKSGTGMGLAIAKGIVEAHGGHISIEDSGDSNGISVVVVLPTGDIEENGREKIGKEIPH